MLNMKVIEDYKRENNLSTTQFCKKCGISIATYRKIEKGETHLRLKPILKIITTIKCKCDDFLGI